MVEFVKARRIQPNHRALFILHVDLIAIIGSFILWGFKTPAICLFFLQANEEDDVLATCDWMIQIICACFALLHNCLVS